MGSDNKDKPIDIWQAHSPALTIVESDGRPLEDKNKAENLDQRPWVKIFLDYLKRFQKNLCKNKYTRYPGRPTKKEKIMCLVLAVIIVGCTDNKSTLWKMVYSNPMIALTLGVASSCITFLMDAHLAHLWQKRKQLQVKDKDDAIDSFKKTPKTHVTMRRVMKSRSKQSPSQENTDDDRTFQPRRTVGRGYNAV